MSHGRRHPKSCKVCGITDVEAGVISATGLCPWHSYERLVDNNTQLRAHDGPYFDRWRKRLLASFGVGLVDDAHGNP